MSRALVLDDKTVFYLGVLIGAATKENTDPLVRQAAEDIFDRVYERETVEMVAADDKLKENLPSEMFRKHSFYYMSLLQDQRTRLWRKMGIKVPITNGKEPSDLKYLTDIERNEFFLNEVGKQNRIDEMFDLIEEIRKES